VRIDRYILSQLLRGFGLFALVLVMVYWVNRAVILFDQLIADGQSAWVFLEFTALALPSIVRIVLPIAAFGATVWAMNRLIADSEVTVLRSAGLSPWRLARPVLWFGLVVAALSAALVHAVGPLAAERLNERRVAIAETATARLLREGEFVSPVPGLTLYIREITPAGELRGLLLSDSRDPAVPVTYAATSAFLVRGAAGPQLVMLGGSVQRLTREDGRLVVTSFADLAYDLGPLLGAPEPGHRASRQLSTWELLRPTPALAEKTGKSPEQLFAEGHDRLAEPLLAPVAALIGFAALLLGPFSRFGLTRQIVGAVVLVVFLQGVEAAATQAMDRDPGLWPAAYLPATVGLGIALGLLAAAAGRRPARAGA
jgi:lipopolysaccharide export system permease protein